MKLKRLMALVMSIALTVASHPSVRVAAQVAEPVVPSQQAIQATGLTHFGHGGAERPQDTGRQRVPSAEKHGHQRHRRPHGQRQKRRVFVFRLGAWNVRGRGRRLRR